MKANAPEKIYLEREKETDRIHHLWGRTPVISSLYEHIEYFRTDVFIEKALKFLDGCIPDYIDLIHANVDTFMDVDNKRFIEDFRKYMKE